MHKAWLEKLNGVKSPEGAHLRTPGTFPKGGKQAPNAVNVIALVNFM